MSLDKVFTTFRAPVNSYPLGEMNLGLMKPGRYSGFDVMVENIGLDVMFNHTGLIKKSSAATDDTIVESYFGALLMPSGSTIHNVSESVLGDIGEGVNLTIDTNIANANIRYDLLICEHRYIPVIGGEPPLYFIQKGPNDGTMPLLANPEKQIVIGTIRVNPNGYQFSDLTYTPMGVPLMGSMTPQELADLIYDLILGYATFDVPGLIELATAAEAIARTDAQRALTPASVITMVATDAAVGMVQKATVAEIKTGTNDAKYMSVKQVREYGGIRNINHLTTGSFTLTEDHNGQLIILEGDAGVLPQVLISVVTGLPKNFHCHIISRSQTARFITTGTTLNVQPGHDPESASINTAMEIFACKDESPATQFVITGTLKLSDTSASSGLVPRKAAVPYFPDGNSLAEFNGTGLGISGDVIGWAICNGQNGTRDLRGRFLVSYADAGAASDEYTNDERNRTEYNAVAKRGGEYKHQLVPSELPNTMVVGITASGPSGGGFIVTGNGDEGAISVPTGGENTPHNNLPPFYTTLYIQRVA